MPRAYSYLRFSTPEQAQGDSFRRQTEAARRYADRHGLELDTRLNFHDRGVSAFRGANAEGGALAAFLAAVDAGEIEPGSFLLVESLDRISRQTARRAVRTLESIVERDVSVVDLSDGDRVYSVATLDSDQWAFTMMTVRFIRAHEESLLKSSRLKAAWSNKRQLAASKPLSARAPSWLELSADRTWRVREDRAAVVRRIFEMAGAGIGEHSIAATLNQEGVAPFGNGVRTAIHWHRTSVAKILRNPAVVGTLQPYTQDHVAGRKRRTAQDPVEGYFPQVVDQNAFDALRAMRIDATSPRRGRHAETEVRNILGGLARCPLCGGSMTRVSKGSRAKAGRPYLVCSKAKAGGGCRYRAVPMEDVENALVRHRAWLSATGPAGAGAADLEERIRVNAARQVEKRAIRTRLVEAVAAGVDSPALLEALADAERDVAILLAFERETRGLIEVATGPLLARRLAGLHEALGAAEIDRAAVNVVLRQLLSAVLVDYRSGLLIVRWKNQGESQIAFADPEAVEDVPEKWKKQAAFFARNRPPRSQEPIAWPTAPRSGGR